MSDNIEKFEGIPEIISEMTRTQMTSQYSVGPLPQEVLSDLTDEDKEKLINNFINQETKDHEKEILLRQEAVKSSWTKPFGFRK